MLSYSTRLHAFRLEGSTRVELSIDQTVGTKVPRLFAAEADRRVQKAADDATAEHETAIREFIAKFENDAIVIPALQ